MYWSVYVCAYPCGLCVESVCVCMPFFSSHTPISKLFLPCRIRPTPIFICLPSIRIRPTTSPPPASFFFLFVCFSSLSYLYLKIYFWMRFALLNFIPTPTFFVEPIFFFKRIHRNVIIPMRVFICFFFVLVFRHFFLIFFFCFCTVASWNRFYCSSHVQYCF